jgi:hypothetical protein
MINESAPSGSESLISGKAEKRSLELGDARSDGRAKELRTSQ